MPTTETCVAESGLRGVVCVSQGCRTSLREVRPEVRLGNEDQHVTWHHGRENVTPPREICPLRQPSPTEPLNHPCRGSKHRLFSSQNNVLHTYFKLERLKTWTHTVTAKPRPDPRLGDAVSHLVLTIVHRHAHLHFSYSFTNSQLGSGRPKEPFGSAFSLIPSLLMPRVTFCWSKLEGGSQKILLAQDKNLVVWGSKILSLKS